MCSGLYEWSSPECDNAVTLGALATISQQHLESSPLSGRAPVFLTLIVFLLLEAELF